MEAIRKIQNVDQGEVHLALPESFWGKEVEIIVFATEPTESRVVTKHPAEPEHLYLGTALGALGRRVGLTDEEIASFEQGRGKTPAEPERFE